MKILIIVQTIVLFIAIGAITQIIILKKQKKTNWWLGIFVLLLMIVASCAIWLN